MSTRMHSLRSLAPFAALALLPAVADAQACLGLRPARRVASAEVVSNFLRDGVTGPSTLGLHLTTGGSAGLFASVETGADPVAGKSAIDGNGIGGAVGVGPTLGPLSLCVGAAAAQQEMVGISATSSRAAFGGVALRLPTVLGMRLSAFGVATSETRTTEPVGLPAIESQGIAYRAGLAAAVGPWLGLRVYQDRFDDDHRVGFSVGLSAPLRREARPAPAPTPVTRPVTSPAPVTPPPSRTVTVTDSAAPVAAPTPVPAPVPAPVAVPVPAPTSAPAPAPAEPQGGAIADLFSADASFTLTGLTFETGSRVIRPSSFPRLDEVAEALRANPEIRVEISGHTDDVGSPDVNQRLSQGRAEAVRNYFIEKGVAADRMTARGFGGSRPVTTSRTPEGREMNRRVEMTRIP